MTSLKESVKRAFVEKFGVGIDPNIGWPEKWADAYVKELIDHLRGDKSLHDVEEEAILGEPDCETIMKMLRFLRGETS